MKLTIYTDASFSEVREVRERDRMRIPYRVAQYVLTALQDLDLKDDQKILHTVLSSEAQITAVVRATFGLTDEELDCVDVMDLADLAKEIIAFVVNKMTDLGVGAGHASGDAEKNAPAPATT